MKRTIWFNRRAARRLGALLLCVVPWTSTQARAAASFPEITDEERALERVAFDPSADFAVLRRHGEFWMLDESSNRFASTLDVHWRAKVLEESGADQAEVDVPHSLFVRLVELEARTITADGKILEVGEDDILTSQLSERFNSRSTKVIFPRAEPGAILDLRYRIAYDSLLFLEPWLFQSEAPTLSSSILFHVREGTRFSYWNLNTSGREIELTTDDEPRGKWILAELADMPAIAAEPYGLPLTDMSAQCMLIPTAISISGQSFPLFADWRNATRFLADNVYSPFLGRRRQMRQKVKQLAPKGTDAEKAEMLLRWVREEITIGYDSGVSTASEAMDDVFESGVASPTEQALILSMMLQQVGVETHPAWAVSRLSGRFDPNYANPGWFDRIILQANLDGESTFIDPLAGGAVGNVEAGLEGSRVVVAEGSSPRIVELPLSAAEANLADASWKLTVEPGDGDKDPSISGSLRLHLGGHAATWSGWWGLGGLGSEAVKETLTERLPRWQVNDVEVTRSPPGVAFDLQVNARLTLRPEETLPDEFNWRPDEFQFDLPRIAGGVRRAPILLPFRYVETTDLELELPAGWALDTTADTTSSLQPSGRFHADIGESDGTVRGSWSLQLTAREAAGSAARPLQKLFAARSQAGARTVAVVGQ